MSGMLNLDKPTGPTSHDMVALVRRRLGLRQVGHAGTLDPLARGVLVIGVGPATRLMTFVGEGIKEYHAELLLGRTTDSQDITGTVTGEASATEVTLSRLEDAVQPLRGPILQTPPMVSAVRHEGRRLYELARQGKTVERQPRPVTVYSLEIVRFSPGDQARASLQIRCSGGVYVRTLCHDIGQALGCGGCMASLCRTAVGAFRVEDSVTPDLLAEKGPAALLPPSTAVAHLPLVLVTPLQEQRVRNGGWIKVDQAVRQAPGRQGELAGAAQEGSPDMEQDVAPGVVRLENQEGQLVAIARTLDIEKGLGCQPFIVLGERE